MGNSKMVKKIVSVGLAVSLFTAPLNAGLGSFIKDNLNGALISDNAGYYKTQGGGSYWTAGGFKMRWDLSSANIQLFHAKAPSFSMGCNGIDATFGSFSFLGFQKLVEKLKKIAAVAPAMAFQMAIMTLCTQCATILHNLEKIADIINNFNIDACKAAGWVVGKMASAINGGKAEDYTDWRSKVRSSTDWGFTSTLASFSQGFGDDGKTGADNIFGHGSALNKVKTTFNTGFMDTSNFVNVMRALIGDVYGFDVKQSDSSGKDETKIGKFMIINPKLSVKEFMKFLVDGGTIKTISVEDNKDSEGHYFAPRIFDEEITISPKDSFVNLFKTRIQAIVNKIEAHTPLSDEEINFINSLPIPLYKIANISATIKQQIEDNLAYYFAYRTMEEFTSKFFQKTMEAIGSLNKNADFVSTNSAKEVSDFLKEAPKRYRELQKALTTQLDEYRKNIKTNNDIINQYKAIEKQMMRNSPIFSTQGL